MQPLSNKHAAILRLLTAGLSGDGPSRKIDNHPGTYMAVVVEKVGPCRYSVAHYYEQNGDLVPDPDVEIICQNGRWYPVAITQWCGYRRVAETDAEGWIVTVNRHAYRDLRRFAGTFLTNIKAQQGNLSTEETGEPEHR